MRFISEDNKVFNTIEECQEHEKSLKENNEKKKQEEFEAIKRRYDSLVDLIDKWEDDYYNFVEKWGVDLKAESQKANKKCESNPKTAKDSKSDAKIPNNSYKSYAMDFKDLLDFLESYFN